uniref:hypothetical protein n=1 Tax=Thaumasiovibrio occultus TaxID=1891184 RepID=UPI000B350728|nr:hypothetical protein [Thaumasiovibrio occultus]
MDFKFTLRVQHSQGHSEVIDVTHLETDLAPIIADAKPCVVLEQLGSATPEALEQLFLIMQSLYRPLMRKRGASLWVHWRRDSVRDIAKGVEALCQVMAMELARKQVSVNMVSADLPLDDARYQALEQLGASGYITTQSLEWGDQQTTAMSGGER